MSSGTAFGHLFTVAASPLLTRLYGPDDFANLGLFTSYLAVAGVAVALQYEASIMSAKDTDEAAYLTLSSGLIGIPTSVLAGIGLWLLIHNSVLGFGRLPGYVPIALAAVMCFVGQFAILRYWSLRKQNFRDVSQAIVAQSGARAILQSATGLFGLHNSGLILGETLGRGVGMGRMFRTAWPELRTYAVAFRWQECKTALRRNWKFPVLSFPSSFIDALCASLPLPLLVQAYGTEYGGYYALVWRVLALPSVLITQAVADSFHSHIALCAREKPEGVLEYFKRTSMSLFLGGAIPCAILVLWSRPLFAVIFGAQWRIAGTMAALVVPWYLGQFVVNPLSRVVLVLSGQETKLVWDLICLIAIPGVFYAAHVNRLSVLSAVTWLAIVNGLLYVAYWMVLLRLLFRHHRTVTGSGSLTDLKIEGPAE